MRLKNTDLIAALAVSIVNILCVLLPGSPPWLKTALALPLIFVLPGYLLTEILFQRRKIAMSHRLLLTPGLSIVSVITSGLLLNILASGLQSVSWLVCLSSLTIAGILIVMVCRGKVEGRLVRIKVLHIYEYFLFGLALGGMIFALQYAREGMAEQPYAGFTQFWIAPVEGNSCGARVGMHSFEAGQIAYSVLITANGMAASAQFPGILQVGEQVERTIDLPVAAQEGTVDVRARLYRLDMPGEVYRSVNIILHCRSPGSF